MLFAAHRTFVIQSLNSYAIARVGVLLTPLEVEAVCVQSFIEAYCRSEQKETASATPQTVTWRTFQVVFLCLRRTFHMSHLEEEQWLWHWDTVVNIHKAKSAPLCSLNEWKSATTGTLKKNLKLCTTTSREILLTIIALEEHSENSHVDEEVTTACALNLYFYDKLSHIKCYV